MKLASIPRTLDVDRAYGCIKRYVLSADATPAERLDPEFLARRHGAAERIVEMALSVLVREELVEFDPDRGYFIRTPSRREIYGLYIHNRDLLVQCIWKAEDDAWLVQYTGAELPIEFSCIQNANGPETEPAEVVRDLFEFIGRLSRNDGALESLRSNSDRLHQVRRAEPRIIEDTCNELNSLSRLANARRYSQLRTAVERYHDRRLLRLPEISRAALGEATANNGNDRADTDDNVIILYPGSDRRRDVR